jgi:anti-sigma B factor antagonist
MLQRKPIQDISVIDVAGDIDFREMIRIKDTIGSLIEKDRTKVVINLRSVDHINYLSIGVLLERLKLLRNLNGDLKLAGMSPFLRDILEWSVWIAFRGTPVWRTQKVSTTIGRVTAQPLMETAHVSVLIRRRSHFCSRERGRAGRHVGGGGHAEQIRLKAARWVCLDWIGTTWLSVRRNNVWLDSDRD